MAEPLAGRRLLVTGGAGFIGSNLVRRCLADGAEHVLVVDNLLSSERDNLPEDERVELWTASIADPLTLDALEDTFDFVFHLSTFHGNQSSIADPLADHEHNLVTTLRLFEQLKDFSRLRRVVYASTGCSLAAKDERVALPVVEDGPIPLDFDSPYQISKVVGEMYALYYGRQEGLPVVRARFQNVYGPGEVLGAGRWRGTAHTVWRNVVPTFVYRGLKGLALELHGDGSASRDFIFVDDIVNGLIRCAVADGIEGDVFNLAFGREVPVRDLAALVNALTDNAGGTVVAPARPWDRSLNRVGSTAKSRERLGFVASVGLEEGLEATVAWTRANVDRIERCIERHRDRLRQEPV
jgi:UDP-glucose 4-epimerase